MAFENTAAEGETNTRAGILFAAMEPLEDPEDAVVVQGVDPDTVVPYAEEPFGGGVLDGNMHPGRLGTAELDRVVQEALEQLLELARIGVQGG